MLSVPPKRMESKKSYIKLNEKYALSQIMKLVEQEKKPGHRSNQKSKSVKKHNSLSKKKKKEDLQDLLKDSYLHVRNENQELAAKLKKKNKKIEELKQSMKTYEGKLIQYEQIFANYDQLAKNKGTFPSSTKESQEYLHTSRKTFQDVAKESHEVAKKSLQKCKRLEKDIEEQKDSYEKEIQRLNDANQRLLQQNLRFSEHLVNDKVSSRKKTNSIKITQNQEVQIDLVASLKEFREKESAWHQKEEQLRRMLNDITTKINSFQHHCKNVEEQAKRYRHKFEEIEQKYKRKSLKYKSCNEKWGTIFKDFLKQSQYLDKEIENLKNLIYIIVKKQKIPK